MEIAGLVWTRHNAAKLAEHGIAQDEVEELVAGTYALDVHPDYPDQVRITGPTFAGRFLTIALEPVDEEQGLWSPITGWQASDTEEAYYWRESL